MLGFPGFDTNTMCGISHPACSLQSYVCNRGLVRGLQLAWSVRVTLHPTCSVVGIMQPGSV